MEVTLRAAGMRGFDTLMHSLGEDPLPYIKAVGIAETALDDDEERIPLNAYTLLLENAAQATGCKDLGLRMAEVQDISILGPLAIAMQNARSIGEALTLCSRYLYTHSPGIRLSLHPLSGSDQDCTALRMQLILPSWWKQSHIMDQCLADLHHFTALLVGAPETLNKALHAVQLPHAPTASKARYKKVFGHNVEFQAAQAQLVVSNALLERNMAGISAQLHQLSIDYLQLAYSPLEASLTEKVEDILRRALSSTRGRRDVVAQLLDLHPRTLQRRLSDEGVNFQDLVERARREQAQHWLTTSRLPLTQVAGLVGLADQTVLNRNCQRWFNCTPLQLRSGKREI